jgi:hypothetical protein
VVFLNSAKRNQAWCFTPVIPEFGKLKQQDCEFLASWGYVVRSISKTLFFVKKDNS